MLGVSPTWPLGLKKAILSGSYAKDTAIHRLDETETEEIRDAQ